MTTIAIAFFITPHGFGHATRAAAVMEALLRRQPEIHFEIFTTTPRQIFARSIGNSFGYHPIRTDIGMIQLSPLEEDLSATCDQLDLMLPLDQLHVDLLAEQLARLNCRLVICDIAPLGIEVARSAGIASVLIENFTWDWIYQGYLANAPRLKPHIDYLADIFRRPDHHIQTPPICNPADGAEFIAPISRSRRADRKQVRKDLGIAEEEKMVMVSMGGVPDRHDFLSKLPADLDFHLVISGAETGQSSRKRVTLLTTHSPFFHPDLVAAADAFVGKAGYSTVAEVYQCGVPFGYIQRPLSPESAVLESFIERHMPCLAITPESYSTGQWIQHLPKLLAIPRGPAKAKNGADAAAAHICKILPIRP